MLASLCGNGTGGPPACLAFNGTVTAATDWGDDPQRKRVRDGLSGSYERLFHDAGERKDFMLNLSAMPPNTLAAPLLERAIGVIYRPETERVSHYFEADLAKQFDAVIHLDRTRALTPLDSTSSWEQDAPETFPFGV